MITARVWGDAGLGEMLSLSVATMVAVKKESIDARAGQLLRRSRRRAGLNQVEVAARAGLPQTTISAYESGRRQPTIPMLSKLLEATGAELIMTTGLLPERLSVLSGPVGLRVRRHRHEIVQAASRYGVQNVRVIGTVAHGEPESHLDLLVDQTPETALMGLLNLSNDLEELLGIPVKILTLDRIPSARRAKVEREALEL
jgi:predicted nucleotidyltransferase/DNA-binding XRE family transcriptional regulator